VRGLTRVLGPEEEQMAMKVLVGALIALLSRTAVAGACSETSKLADTHGAHIIPRAAGTVVGASHVPFYSAPLPRCAKREFVVPGDRFIAYRQYRGWTYVMYIHPVTGVDTSGWLPSARLVLTGTVGDDQ